RLVQAAVPRGRVDVSAAVTTAEGTVLNPMSVNVAQSREYADAARKLADALELSDGPSLGWVMGQPGVLTREEQTPLSAEEAWPLLEKALAGALALLVERRETEAAAVERRAARLRERMQAMLGDAPVDAARLAAEVAVWADRTDVSEELARLRAHLAQLGTLLAGHEPVGRTLDFLIQEINREVNTVGSKADDLEISQTVIAAKATLEKMREQVQNIE